MRPLIATIADNTPLLGDLTRLTLAARGLGAAQPGQWVAIRASGSLSILAHPFPLALVDRRGETATIFYRPGVAPGPWLALRNPGAALDVLGPWGRALPVDALARHSVLVGSGECLISLLALATALVGAGVAIVVLHDASTATALLPPALLPPAAEYHVATGDGSAGVSGTVLDLLPPLLPWADTLYAALPPDDYPILRDLVYRSRLRPRRGFATVVAEAPLACYAAACDGCAVPLRNGYGLLCRDGPAFDLLDLQ